MIVCLVCFLVWQEHYYDPHSDQGLPGLQIENSAAQHRKSLLRGAPRLLIKMAPRSETSASEQLSGDERRQAMSVMKRSADQPVVKKKMKMTFKRW